MCGEFIGSRVGDTRAAGYRAVQGMSASCAERLWPLGPEISAWFGCCLLGAFGVVGVGAEAVRSRGRGGSRGGWAGADGHRI